ncbi:Ketosteroid isomerase-related protein [Nonomuraea solani]|uniref:Ketosteroid isomerase-related protein n=1 Tax=Nonomuraea solani TaxID=1144553 RepID=A0A1H6DV43_9ACTN|nr:nuclear transport factor 2 family protein [Nonomuraea solani]SEG89227.1 Ketosteroid isomerase-related protein [Nonomuraea solani]
MSTAAGIRHFYRLIDGDQVTELVDLFADDLCYHRPGFAPLIGREQLRHFYEHDRPIRSGRHTLTGIVVGGATAAVHGSFTGTLRDDRPASHRFADFFSYDDDGLITRRDTFFFVPLV